MSNFSFYTSPHNSSVGVVYSINKGKITQNMFLSRRYSNPDEYRDYLEEYFKKDLGLEPCPNLSFNIKCAPPEIPEDFILEKPEDVDLVWHNYSNEFPLKSLDSIGYDFDYDNGLDLHELVETCRESYNGVDKRFNSIKLTFDRDGYGGYTINAKVYYDKLVPNLELRKYNEAKSKYELDLAVYEYIKDYYPIYSEFFDKGVKYYRDKRRNYFRNKYSHLLLTEEQLIEIMIGEGY